MPDENRFAGLSEEVGDEDEEESASIEADQSDTETDAKSVDDTSTADQIEDTGGPAFEFDATTAKSIYVRDETLELLEDTEFEVESILRREYDIRDLTGREFHDAVIHVINEHVHEVADRINSLRDGE